MKNIRKIVNSTKSLIFPAIILLLLIFVIQPENMVGTIYPTYKVRDYIVIK
jgi:hypothetical protein